MLSESVMATPWKPSDRRSLYVLGSIEARNEPSDR
jgi:hypothetical protein